ncbi:uncharacterized protein EDB93DRAFT_1170618 [Suillus bovinus]|uniref:uncharacterized protein n=1 Tax=Suillus bovinus TaxID=48563 RepID=UPI001B886E8C|nr:uncharacterized protein EDB93DRAFT_1170618 [Suillus bovinus]KAG2135735.1 hypothetical protein EDB93DRAFT_1170618 [Suillus bovinus]
MASTASQLEQSSKRPQISASQEQSTVLQWVPCKYSSDVSQYVLVRPPQAPCGNRQLFGFPIVKKELWDLGTISFRHIMPGKTLPDDHTFLVMNSLTFLKFSLRLAICTMARGKVVGDSDNIPPECMKSPGKAKCVPWRRSLDAHQDGGWKSHNFDQYPSSSQHLPPTSTNFIHLLG